MRKPVLFIGIFAILFCLTACDNEIIYESGDLRSLSGVTMTAEKDVYSRDIDKINVVWNNDTSATLLFGESFRIDKKADDKWEKIQINDNFAFISIGYLIPPFSHTDHTYYFSGIYDNLKAGDYRIVTRFFNNADVPVTSDDKYWVYAEFSLI